MNRRRVRSSEQPRERLSKRRKFVACVTHYPIPTPFTHNIAITNSYQSSTGASAVIHIKSNVRATYLAPNVDKWAAPMTAPTRPETARSSYLDELVAENRRLKEQSASASHTEADRDNAENGPARPADATDGPDEGNTSVRNPLIGDRAWFHRYDPSTPPIYIGEAACTAFATRFRRFLTGNNATAHIPRTQYVKDDCIAAANTADVQWPSLQQARLLVKIAMQQVCHIYHLVLRKSTLEKLEDIYRTGDFECTVNKCKFFALFAFGEAYSMRAEPSTGSRVPGTTYFARALSLVQLPPERTNITHLETLLLLSLFSYYLNRRHSSLVLIGTAMRLGLSIGMNHNIPETQLIDPVERQHRLRIWWTIYVFDRMWGSKMGQPSQILDDDIHLDMPSSITPAQLHDEQFSDTDHLTANINLARIVGETIAKLYSRRKYSETFLQRVQKLLKALKNWVETLPEHLRLNEDDLEVNRKPISSLHLSFNQCVILTTRPTLLHLLINNRTTDISQPVLTLGEACIHAARHSYSVILTKWINGSLPVFGYFHAHYLFSLALVLAMASFLPIGSPSDLGAFETSLEMLRSMSENGNLAAAEFHMNLVQVKECLDQYRDAHPSSNPSSSSASSSASNPHAHPSTNPPLTSTTPFVESTPIPLVHQPTSIPNNSIMTPEDEPLGLSSYALPPSTTAAGAPAVPGFTTAMAFMEPTMQDFLAQSDFDLGLLHPVDTFISEESFYTSQGI
ncbi:transcription factor domain-containing protein [Aspergillus affinis]|uniref:transcription factor domain-containing protein n=1 Tax=Aspergillus affinis TaxID=1070780 RepID=UPI0022FEA30F|nr:fungal-specific transcription factor [Aspergillus affinis]KAI9037330.1 fungal-specific transcription factor [Aspergillus affinis]